MTRRGVLTVGILLLLPALAAGDPRSSFEEGVRLYRQNDMEGAIRAWENVIRQNVVSGPLLYNLGNAYYRSGQVGKSILYYERARRLLPRERDVVANLELVKLATVDRIEQPVRLVIWDWVDSVRDYFSLSELATLIHVLGLAAAGVLLASRWWRQAGRYRLRVAATVLVVAFACTSAWYVWRAALDAREFAVVMVAKSDVYSAPDGASMQLLNLHEGTTVRMGERLTDWVMIRLADGRKGWVRSQDIQRI